MEEMNLSALVILMKPLSPYTPTRTQQFSLQVQLMGRGREQQCNEKIK